MVLLPDDGQPENELLFNYGGNPGLLELRMPCLSGSLGDFAFLYCDIVSHVTVTHYRICYYYRK